MFHSHLRCFGLEFYNIIQKAVSFWELYYAVIFRGGIVLMESDTDNTTNIKNSANMDQEYNPDS